MSNEIDKSGDTSSFIPFSVPFKLGNSNMKYNYFDVELNNLKRAYGVFLEPSDSINLLNCSTCNDGENQGVKQEPLECSENESSEVDKDASLPTNNSSLNESCNCKSGQIIPQLQECCNVCHLDLIDSLRTPYKIQLMNFEDQLILKNKFQEGLFYCSQCGKNFTHHTLLLAHLSVHDKIKCFKCPTCDKVFPAHRYLMRHLQYHKKEVEMKKEVWEQTFKCSTCQKCFRKKESLVKHSRIHTRDLLKCSVCDFTCSKKVDLKMHVASHEGNRKYKCDRCDFSFKQIGHLKRHIARFKH